MSESEMVKMCVILAMSGSFIIPAVIGSIVELIRHRKNKGLFRDKEALKLLRYMRSDD